MNARTKRPAWLRGLSEKDWLFDGQPILGASGLRLWRKLDWSKAYMDMGPSPAGNPGPYWHVPFLPDDGSRHRLYPKVMQGRWALVIRQAILFEARRHFQAMLLRKNA